MTEDENRVGHPFQEDGDALDGSINVEGAFFEMHVVGCGVPMVLALAGELDMTTAPLLRSRMAHILEHRNVFQIVLDLSGLEYIDSVGFGALIEARNIAHSHGGAIGLTGLTGQVARAFWFSGLATRFLVTATVEEGVHRLKGTDNTAKENNRLG